jgi:glycosyltransferase involved in cell wall biosynthesis
MKPALQKRHPWGQPRPTSTKNERSKVVCGVTTALQVEDPFANPSGKKDRYSLWEVYGAADFITYPSLYEGFGNALLEAIYFKKPILVNRYKIFVDDIEPKGFELVTMDGALTDEVVKKIQNIVKDKDRQKKMVNKNYRLALKHYSYSSLRKQLALIMPNLFHHNCLPHREVPQSALGS